MAHLIRACLSLLAVIIIFQDPLTHTSMSGHAAANLVTIRAIYDSTARMRLPLPPAQLSAKQSQELQEATVQQGIEGLNGYT